MAATCMSLQFINHHFKLKFKLKFKFGLCQPKFVLGGFVNTHMHLAVNDINDSSLVLDYNQSIETVSVKRDLTHTCTVYIQLFKL